MKRRTKQASKVFPVYERIRQILESARTSAARSVNTAQVVHGISISMDRKFLERTAPSTLGFGTGQSAESRS
jgi:hypothetical protein